MTHLRIWIAAALLALLATPAHAAGTVTVTTSEVSSRSERLVRYTVAWTSDAAGDVTGNAFDVVAGRLVSIRFVPGTGGVAPDDLYDVTLTDGDVTDLLDGQGANRSATATSLVQWDPALFQDGSRTYDVVVANAGNANSGTVVILVRVQ